MRFAAGSVAMETERTDVALKAVGEARASFSSGEALVLENEFPDRQHGVLGDSPQSLQSREMRCENGTVGFGNGTASFADVELHATGFSNGLHGAVES